MTISSFNTALLARAKRVSIIDPCPYGRDGWHAVFQLTKATDKPSDVFIAESILDLFENKKLLNYIHTWHSSSHYLILRLPSHAQQAVLMLLQLSAFTSSLSHYQCLIVITPFPQNIIRHVLSCFGIQNAVHIVTNQYSLPDFCHYVLSLSQQKKHSHFHTKSALSETADDRILTPTERKVLHQALLELPLHWQVRMNNSLAKTIYSQRRHALIKLGVRDILSLLRLFVCNKYNHESETEFV